ncbi:hypothetical protein CB0940_12155 [Cercospora beticola]|uniref:MARVEL domain-containing protein n=1 Tax=Cercospora beticola TaxID=122368 RepID=A0A2G5GIE2_CERBT|nr:hypothetical protein CB0940_12155 [Cercospora beticola]PIA80057.1 hypothetical protein CB0940_12155 [Cercospora beticola]WPB07656.1 hypothetical protein RHO25_012317 [Cercospora beticola]CAK1356541.1 unnamed protein product [Cercospora beticola]
MRKFRFFDNNKPAPLFVPPPSPAASSIHPPTSGSQAILEGNTKIMEKKKLGSLVARCVQFFSAAIVLGLSISIYKHLKHFLGLCHDYYAKRDCGKAIDPWTPVHAFSACVGVVGLLSAAIGIIATVTSLGEKKIVALVTTILDVLAALFFLAGGVTSAVKYAGDVIPCDSPPKEHILTLPPCSRARAATAFLFIGLLATLVASALAFFSGRASGKRSTSGPVGHEL